MTAPVLCLWNWKSALVSAICRSAIFFTANTSAGLDAAMRAMLSEFLFRAAAAGFFGAMTQALLRLEGRRATMAALVLVPSVAHGLEYLVHRAAGTPALGLSVAASVAFSALTTLFNVHAMRQGALLTGRGSASLGDDLRRLPSLASSFVAGAARTARGRR